jgi:hypothetical protein
VITGAGRVGVSGFSGALRIDADTARGGRYIYLVAALLLPALAVAADALVERWRVLIPVVAALFLIGIPGNLATANLHGTDRFMLGDRNRVLALGQAPFARQVPPSTRPLGLLGPDLTLGWLLAGVDSGRIPKPSFSARRRATLGLELALRQQLGGSASALACAPLTVPVERRLRRGESFETAHGAIDVVLVHDGVLSEALRYGSAGSSRLEATGGPLDLRISRSSGSPVLCP